MIGYVEAGQGVMVLAGDSSNRVCEGVCVCACARGGWVGCVLKGKY